MLYNTDAFNSVKMKKEIKNILTYSPLLILLNKVVRVFFYLKLKISITTELIGFSISSKLYKGPVTVLDYFIIFSFFLAHLCPIEYRAPRC